MLGVHLGETVGISRSRQEANIPSQNHDELYSTLSKSVRRWVTFVATWSPVYIPLPVQLARVTRDYVTLMVLRMVWSGCTIGVVGAGINVGPDTVGRE
ncbi:hypothetical protein CPLU01_09001 [Colletotrichum plurivorum]|uniref:Uncharacterized protein n=1 Tax=Colletotrichum plurivorum TaxID=2175906 RepID=A0A8H6KBF4_9PEZI|nr:hypothetical protein CPLU01_09001 [Colletotrichum plurivorum]